MKRLYIIYVTVLIICEFTACKSSDESQEIIVETVATQELVTQNERNEICVYIVGEVVNPGVYVLEEHSRICDVVEMAGGFTDNAATEYINLASIVSDEEKIIVYSLDEVLNGEVITENENLININTATKEQLMTLPGIGESKASDIIKYREENGKFQTKEDIMKVPGIKDAAFSKIEELITVK